MGQALLRAGKRERETWWESTLALNVSAFTCHWPRQVTLWPYQWGGEGHSSLRSHCKAHGDRAGMHHPLLGRGRERLRLRVEGTTGLYRFSSNMCSLQRALPRPLNPRRLVGAERLTFYLQSPSPRKDRLAHGLRLFLQSRTNCGLQSTCKDQDHGGEKLSCLLFA